MGFSESEEQKKKDRREVTSAKEACRIPAVRPAALWESEREGCGQNTRRNSGWKAAQIWSDMNVNIQAHHTRNAQRPKSRHIISKVSKDKKRKSWKHLKEKQIVTYKKSTIRLFANFSLETLKARRQLANTFKVLKEKKYINPNPIPSKTVLQRRGRLSLKWQKLKRILKAAKKRGGG